MLAVEVESLDYQDAYGQKGLIESLAHSYVSDIEGRKVLVNNEREGKLLVLPYLTRFDSYYYDDKLKALKALRKENITGGVFLTLTIDPSRFHSFKSAYRALMEGFAKLMDLYRYRLKPNGKEIIIARMLQFQDNGMPHLHVIFGGIKWLEEWETLKERWDKKYDIGSHVDVRRIWDRYNAVSYVIRYIKRSYLKDPDKHFMVDITKVECRRWDALALSWALGARVWALSLLHADRLIPKKPPNAVSLEGGSDVGGDPPPFRTGWEVLPSAVVRWRPGLYVGPDRYAILAGLRGLDN